MNYPVLSNSYLFAGHEFRIFLGKDYVLPFEEASRSLRHIFSHFLLQSDEPLLNEENHLPYPFYGRDFREAGPVVIQWSYPEQVFYWRWGQPSLFHIEALSDKILLPAFLHRIVANIQTLCLEVSPFIWISGLTLSMSDKIKIFIGSVTPTARDWASNWLEKEDAELWSYGVTMIDPETLKFTSHLPPILTKDGLQLSLPHSLIEEVNGFIIFKEQMQEEIMHKKIECYWEENGIISPITNSQLILTSLLKNSNLCRFGKNIPDVLQILGEKC